MKSTLIIYKSNTGFTKKYVDWITDAVTCQTITIDLINSVDINNFNIIIYGAGIKAGHIQGLKEFKKKVSDLSSKRIVVFATGGAPFDKEIISNIKFNNFSEEELKSIEFFYFQSGLNYNKMRRSEKAMMYIYKKILELKNNRTALDDETSKAISTSYDYSSSEYIKPMITYLNQLLDKSSDV